MKQEQPQTIREQIAWSYANLARAHAALDHGATSYQRFHHVIRARLYRGLLDGSMAMRSLYDDERLKMKFPQACYYCGNTAHLCVDHLIPRIRGGADEADNLIWSCRACNSSKGGRDMLEWMHAKQMFPSILLLRRYIKIVARYCTTHDLMDCTLDELDGKEMPFDIRLLPTTFPPLTELRLWVPPVPASRTSRKHDEGSSTRT